MWSFIRPLAKFFSADERRQVEVLFDALLPGDATSPGASDVGAAAFLDGLLTLERSTYYEIPAWRELYRRSLPVLDAASPALFDGKRLRELDRDQATELLRRLEAGTLGDAPSAADQRRFFATLRNHCIEGAFSDPRWGGNTDGLMWRWYGYPSQTTDYARDTKGKLEKVRRDAE